jgi:methyl-accepting chemotaxis protein
MDKSMRLGIRAKQLGAFGAVLVLLLGVAYVGWRNTALFSAELEQMYLHSVKASTHLAKAERGLWELRFALPNYIAGDPAVRERINADTPKWLKQVDDNLKAYRTLADSADEKKLLEEWDEHYAKYLAARPQFFSLLDEGKVDQAKKFRAEQTNPPAAKAVTVIARLDELQERRGEARQRAVAAMASSSRSFLIGLAAAALTVGIALSLVLSRMIARPLGEMAEVLEAVGGGDFTQRAPVSGTDELVRMASALNQAVDSMRAALQEVSVAANDTAAATQELSVAAEQLSSGAQEQAASLEETAASLEEMTGTVKQNADNARQANQLAVGSRDVAEKGGQVVVQAVRSMTEINQASQKIAAIITTIDEIAFQTNLLALNAAVEAARAGEQGRGFAVVASEVRNLAQRSAGAAKEIKGLIEDSVGKVEAGSELVNKSGEALGEIVTSVKRVTDIIGEIAAASEEQTTGIDQVNKAVMQMDEVTQASAAQTEELSSTAQALAAQAEQLQALVGRFKLDERPAARTHAGATGRAVLAAGVTRKPSPKPAATTLAGYGRRAGDARLRGMRKTDKPVVAEAPPGNGHTHGVDDGFEEF